MYLHVCMLVADILGRDENEMRCCSMVSFPFVREKLYRGLQLQTASDGSLPNLIYLHVLYAALSRGDGS